MNLISESMHTIEHFIHNNPNYGIMATFIISFIESLAIIGSIVPGSVTMSIIGSMIGASLLPLIPTLLVAFAGSYTGDIISFLVGQKCQPKLQSITWVKNNQQWIKKAENFINKYGFASIIIGRFFGPMRSIIPMIAGALNMSNLTFFSAAIPSAALWAIVYLIPGIIIGMFANELDLFSKENIFMLVIILIISCLAIYNSKRIVNILQRLYQAAAKAILPNLEHDILHLRAFAIFNLIIFGVIVLTMPYLNSKYNFYYLLQSLHTTYLNYTMTAITLLADKYTFIAVLTILALASKPAERKFILKIAVASLMITFLAKMLFSVHRPPKIDQWNSFPSGHSTRASLLLHYIGLRFFYKNNTSQKVIWLIISMIAFSRLYIGAHWWPDVLAGIVLGTSIIYFAFSVKGKYSQQLYKNNFVITAIVIAYCAVCYITVNSGYLEFFFGMPEPKTLNTKQWLTQPNIVPSYLNNRFNKPYEPLNIQWLNNTKDIKQYLIQQGWHVNKWPNSWLDRLEKTIKNPELKLLPPLPKLHNNQPPVIIASKNIDNSLKLIMLWQSKYQNLLVGNSSLYLKQKNNVYRRSRFIPFLTTNKYNIKQQPLIQPPIKTLFEPMMVTKIFSRS